MTHIDHLILFVLYYFGCRDTFSRWDIISCTTCPTKLINRSISRLFRQHFIRKVNNEFIISRRGEKYIESMTGEDIIEIICTRKCPTLFLSDFSNFDISIYVVLAIVEKLLVQDKLLVSDRTFLLTYDYKSKSALDDILKVLCK